MKTLAGKTAASRSIGWRQATAAGFLECGRLRLLFLSVYLSPIATTARASSAINPCKYRELQYDPLRSVRVSGIRNQPKKSSRKRPHSKSVPIFT
jgi:hypothetical protein